MENQQQKQTVEQQQAAAQARRDPVQRQADGADYNTVLKGAAKDRSYVFVYQNSNDMGPDYYRELGYVVERYHKDSPTVFALSKGKDNDPILFRGHVLMSIEKSRLEELRANGAPGAGKGSLHWTQMERRLLAKGQQQIDHLRGITGRAREYMAVINNTSVSEGIGRI